MLEIWAVLEHRDSILAEESGELLAELTDVAQRQPEQAQLCAVIATSSDTDIEAYATQLASLGVQHLYLVEHPALAHYTTEAYVDALAWLLGKYHPLLIAASATANGRDWLPRLAARLHLPCVPGCLGIDLRDDGLFALRSIYDGRAYVQTHTALHGKTALATLVPGVRGNPITHQAEQHLIVTRIVPHLDIPQEQYIHQFAVQAPSPEAVELDAAERIIAGGRGIGQAGFTNVATFARLLGAAVGATRVATDRGWIAHDRQIGATGKNVHPRLYIACGISGAAQHTSGMREAQTVVAINPDRSAPIFSLADLGLLGDANQILPLAAKMLEDELQANDTNELIAISRAWVKDHYSGAEHLLKAEEWLSRINPSATLAMQLATLTHDMERAFPGPDSPKQDPSLGPDDPVYNQAHSERSVSVVSAFLHEQHALEDLITQVAHFIRLHEFGGDPEADYVQAADSLSFLEVNIDFFLNMIDAPNSIWNAASVRAKFDWMYHRINIPAARALATPLYEAAIQKLEALVIGETGRSTGNGHDKSAPLPVDRPVSHRLPPKWQ